MQKMFRKGIYLFLTLSLLLTNCSGDKDSDTGDETSLERTDSSPEDSKTEETVPSPRREASGIIDGVSITVDYGSPAVRDRKIWGDLEAYGKVWRAGANATTAITFDKDVLVGGKSLEAGKYAFFMIPTESEWTIIFNKDWDEWGAYNYDESQDVLRLQVTPKWEDEVEERLIYELSEEGLHFAWEKVRITIDIQSN